MSRLKKSYSKYLLLLTIAFSLVGCSDELDYPQIIKEGYPATISVDVNLPEMTSYTRADMYEGLDYKVESLWIGVYNAASKAKTGELFVDKANIADIGSSHELKKINIEAKTGYSYIVAVANYEGRNCLDFKEDMMSYEAALKAADTFDKFKGISAMFNDEGQINASAPVNALLMSGHYLDNISDCNGSYSDPVQVAVTENTSLSGAIHLRRLISQVKFEVTYDQENISDFQIISYQVKNVPNQSWLYERTGGSDNVGDDRKIGTLGSYQLSDVYTQLSPDGAKWSFDWWQLENKRTGKDWVEKYTDRELEYKDTATGTNTGRYKSLLADSKTSETIPTDLSNNNATLVEMKVRMTMSKDENGEKLESGKRTVEATYTIHLGYCENKEYSALRSRDFNCRRNAKYTYNVKISNIKDIYVEATSDIENAPGAEGIITDVESKYVELDAHYGVYNIYLPDAPAGDFRYVVRCYDANSNLISFDSNNPSSVDDKYKEWIKIKKTTGKAKLALYKDETDSPLYSLDKFREKAVEAGWYTVFFNEYVYEDSNGGTSNWKDYVNQPARQVWLSVNEAISSDKESIKYSSQYTFSQKSIQTYYGSGTTALGMEYDNESYGLNMRNSFNNSSKGTNKNNGRYNTAVYLSKSSSDSFTWNDNSYDWSSFVDYGSYQELDAINNSTLGITKDAQKVTDGNPVALPLLKSYYDTSGKNPTANSYDPNPDGRTINNYKYVEAINACMNRNRDLDGDGKIDADELRWYVPTINQYTQIILGSASLSEPIMDYSKHPSIKANNGDNMNLFLYGSNGEVIWLMEGFSTSTWKSGEEHALYATGTPWEIRCVRNLGTENSKIKSTTEVEDAYALDGNTIRMTYYDSKSIRNIKINKMYPHDVANEVWNSVSKAFEYKTNTTKLNGYPIDKTRWTGYNNYYSNWATWLTNANPCDVYNTNGDTGWRVPNQKELMIMMSKDIVTEGKIIYDISATFAHYNGGEAFSDSFDGFPIMMVRRDDSGTGVSGMASGTQKKFSVDDYLRCVRDVD